MSDQPAAGPVPEDFPPAPGSAATDVIDVRDLAPTTGRFADVRAADYVRDALALVLLLVSVNLVWRGDGATTAQVPWALAATILPVLGLVLPYLARLRALPATWSVHTTRRVRVLVALPYVAAVVAQIVLDALTTDRVEGVGAAAALGLAGALLVAVPREHELGPREIDRDVTGAWTRATVVATLLTAAGLLAWLVISVLGVADRTSSVNRTQTVLLVVATLLLGLALLVPVLAAGLGGSVAWSRALVAVATGQVLLFFATSGLHFETLHMFRDFAVLPTCFGALLIPAVAVLASSPAVRRRVSRGDDASDWFATVRAVLLVHAILAVTVAVVSVLQIFQGRAAVEPRVTSAVLAVIMLVVVLVAFGATTNRRPADARGTLLILAAVLLVLGVVLVRSDGGALAGFLPLQVVRVVAGLALPLAVVIALVVPTSVREHLAANPRSPRPGDGAYAYVWSPRPRQARPTRAAGSASAPAPQGYASAPTAQPVGGQGYGSAPSAYGTEPSAYGTAPSGYEAPGAVGQPGYGQPGGYAPPAADAQSGYGYGAVPESAASGTAGADGAAHDALVPGAPSAGAAADQAAVTDAAGGPGGVAPEAPLTDASPALGDAGASSGAPVQPEVAPVSPVEKVAATSGPTPSVPPAPEVRHEAGFTSTQAADPRTPAATLAQIAQDAPTLRAAIASNPTTYPALLDWLAQLGDPEVDAALAARRV